MEGAWGVRSVGDGRNQLEDACTAVSGGAWMEGVSTNLGDGGRVDVKGEGRLETTLDARHT